MNMKGKIILGVALSAFVAVAGIAGYKHLMKSSVAPVTTAPPVGMKTSVSLDALAVTAPGQMATAPQQKADDWVIAGTGWKAIPLPFQAPATGSYRVSFGHTASPINVADSVIDPTSDELHGICRALFKSDAESVVKVRNGLYLILSNQNYVMVANVNNVYVPVAQTNGKYPLIFNNVKGYAYFSDNEMSESQIVERNKINAFLKQYAESQGLNNEGAVSEQSVENDHMLIKSAVGTNEKKTMIELTGRFLTKGFVYVKIKKVGE